MRFKVGDKVRVREWDDMKEEFGKTCFGDIKCNGLFTASMKDYCGEILTIESVGDGRYGVEGNRCSWSDDMLLPAVSCKADLKEMMICEQRDGERFFWIDEMLKGIHRCCSGVSDDLTNERGNKDLDIVKVFDRSDELTLKEMLKNPGRLIWERQEEKEISSEEAFRVLKEHYGCDVKIKEK